MAIMLPMAVITAANPVNMPGKVTQNDFLSFIERLRQDWGQTFTLDIFLPMQNKVTSRQRALSILDHPLIEVDF
ncbi:MAG: hypothetical protein C4531_12950 [Desulfurivibrio sp.]|nr:MAG: hypothetical protein C4531_12950 [Desulfurivibrio sp.]